MIDPQPRAWSLLVPIAGFVWIVCLLISIGARMPQPGPGASGADIAALYGAHAAGAAVSAARIDDRRPGARAVPGRRAVAGGRPWLADGAKPPRDRRAAGRGGLRDHVARPGSAAVTAMGYLVAHLADPGELNAAKRAGSARSVVVSDAPFGAFIKPPSGLAIQLQAPPRRAGWARAGRCRRCGYFSPRPSAHWRGWPADRPERRAARRRTARARCCSTAGSRRQASLP